MTSGLLFSGEQGVQLTWMDAKVGDWVVTRDGANPLKSRRSGITHCASWKTWPEGSGTRPRESGTANGGGRQE